MLTVCFYQDSRHEQPLNWIRKVLGIGYVSRRSDGISKLRINGYTQMKKVLLHLTLFIKFKKIQAKLLLTSACILERGDLSKIELEVLIDNIIKMQSESYRTKRKRNKEELLHALGLTP